MNQSSTNLKVITYNIEVTPPPGYEVDRIHSTATSLIFKPVAPKITCWEECNKISGFYIKENCDIECAENLDTKSSNRNVFTTIELALATIAIAQLSQAKLNYNGNWIPKWGGCETAYIITYSDKIEKGSSSQIPYFLSFPNREIRDKFYSNFMSLIIQAAPILGGISYL